VRDQTHSSVLSWFLFSSFLILSLFFPSSTESQTHRSSDSLSSWFMRYLLPLFFLSSLRFLVLRFTFRVSPISTTASRSLYQFPFTPFTPKILDQQFSLFSVAILADPQPLSDLLSRNVTQFAFSP